MPIIDLTPNDAPRVGTGLSNVELNLNKVRLNSQQLRFDGGDNVTTTIVLSVTSSITYYKRGYHAATGQYEYWRTNVRDDGPPSGNTLIDITVVGEVKEC